MNKNNRNLEFTCLISSSFFKFLFFLFLINQVAPIIRAVKPGIKVKNIISMLNVSLISFLLIMCPSPETNNIIPIKKNNSPIAHKVSLKEIHLLKNVLIKINANAIELKIIPDSIKL